jgi:hypothetical protein
MFGHHLLVVVEKVARMQGESVVVLDHRDVDRQCGRHEARLGFPGQSFGDGKELGHRRCMEGALRQRVAVGQQLLHADELVLVTHEQVVEPTYHRLEVGPGGARRRPNETAQQLLDLLDEQGEATFGRGFPVQLLLILPQCRKLLQA